MDDQKNQPRNLTDADIEALSAAMEKRIVNRFYLNLGSGLWGLIWKGILLVSIFLAAYGAGKGH